MSREGDCIGWRVSNGMGKRRMRRAERGTTSARGHLALASFAFLGFLLTSGGWSFAIAPAAASLMEPPALAHSLSETDEPTKARVQEAFGAIPLAFIENQGQIDTRVGYYVHGRDTTIYFTSRDVTFALTGPSTQPATHTVPAQMASSRPIAFETAPEREAARQRWAIKLDFVGSNPGVQPIGQDRTLATISYFKGPPDQWNTRLPTFATLVYADLWPGIDLVYAGTVDRLKYTFVVKPGADPAQIKLAYRGATAVRLTEAGEMEVNTPVGGFRDDKPV